MMSSDDVLSRAEAALQRHGGQSRLQSRAVQRIARAGFVKAKRMAWITAAFMFGVPLFALFVQPLGISGILLALMAYAGAMLGAGLWRANVEATPADLPKTALARLPLTTETWLAAQRPALPPPAQRLADGIGIQLEQLSRQLVLLDEKEPAAFAIRRLIADELPELVSGYQRVPPHLRQQDIDGLNPDRQLVEGLGVVDSELQRISEQLASGDLTKLATQGRYLELKYQGDSAD
jgi:hypothetical protein